MSQIIPPTPNRDDINVGTDDLQADAQAWVEAIRERFAYLLDTVDHPDAQVKLWMQEAVTESWQGMKGLTDALSKMDARLRSVVYIAKILMDQRDDLAIEKHRLEQTQTFTEERDIIRDIGMELNVSPEEGENLLDQLRGMSEIGISTAAWFEVQSMLHDVIDEQNEELERLELERRLEDEEEGIA